MMVQPTLAVLDGTVSMMSNGPTGGSLSDLKPTETMIVGTDQVAVDALGAELLDRMVDSLPFIAKAESAYVEHVQGHGLTVDKVPVPVPVPATGGAALQSLGPQESYLISLLDGTADVRSIIWVAPLREVDVLRTLRQMLDQGLIELRDAKPGGTDEAASGLAMADPDTLGCPRMR